MRVIIKSIEAEIIDISTIEEEEFVISCWRIDYEVHFPVLSLCEHRLTIDGHLDWKQEDVSIKAIIKYIKSRIKDNK